MYSIQAMREDSEFLGGVISTVHIGFKIPASSDRRDMGGFRERLLDGLPSVPGVQRVFADRPYDWSDDPRGPEFTQVVAESEIGSDITQPVLDKAAEIWLEHQGEVEVGAAAQFGQYLSESFAVEE